MQLADKAALISGAGGGICRAIAVAFAKEGAAIACIDIDPAASAETARLVTEAGGRSLSQACDVANESQTRAAVEAAHEAFGRLDILVSGAAPHDPSGTIIETSLADWQRVLDINLTGAFLLGRAGSAGRAAYCATKGGLIQLAKVMAIDHAAQNIRVNTLSPGAVETQRTLNRYGSFSAAKEQLGAKHLLGRLGRPDEIAGAALFLAADAASFVTGSDLLVDGGYTAI